MAEMNHAFIRPSLQVMPAPHEPLLPAYHPFSSSVPYFIRPSLQGARYILNVLGTCAAGHRSWADALKLSDRCPLDFPKVG